MLLHANKYGCFKQESFLVLYTFLRPNIWHKRVIQQSLYSEYRIVNEELGDLKSLNFKVTRRAKRRIIMIIIIIIIQSPATSQSKAFTFITTFGYRLSLPSTFYNLLTVSRVKFYFLHLPPCICLNHTIIQD